MMDCVEYGSCRRLSALPFVAGKLALLMEQNKSNHAWFTSSRRLTTGDCFDVLVEEGGRAYRCPNCLRFYQWWWSYKSKIKPRQP